MNPEAISSPVTGHGAGAPSDWVRRWSHLVRPGGEVLDVACGQGRHTRWFAGRGHPVTAVDRDAAALSTLAAGTAGTAPVTVLQADLEQAPWPLPGRRFEAVVVTHYLWRPLWPALLDSLAPGGLYLHETFAAGQETVGRPSRPAFLLQPGELLTACAGLRIVAFEDGFLDHPPRFVQRIAAIRPDPQIPGPARHGLGPPAPPPAPGPER